MGGHSGAALATFSALVLDKEGWMRAEVGYGHDDSHSPVPLRGCDPGDAEPVAVPGEGCGRAGGGKTPSLVWLNLHGMQFGDRAVSPFCFFFLF